MAQEKQLLAGMRGADQLAVLSDVLPQPGETSGTEIAGNTMDGGAVASVIVADHVVARGIESGGEPGIAGGVLSESVGDLNDGSVAVDRPVIGENLQPVLGGAETRCDRETTLFPCRGGRCEVLVSHLKHLANAQLAGVRGGCRGMNRSVSKLVAV